MSTTIIVLITLITGMLIGGGLVRYGIGLGMKLVYQIKEDLPSMNYKGEPTAQEFTGEEPEEEV